MSTEDVERAQGGEKIILPLGDEQEVALWRKGDQYRLTKVGVVGTIGAGASSGEGVAAETPPSAP